MPHFAITTSKPDIELPAGKSGKFMFVVTNHTGRALDGQARVTTLGDADPGWFSPRVSESRAFVVDGTQTFNIDVKVPAGAAAGETRFRLDVFETEDAERIFAQGPESVVRTTEGAAPPTPGRRWPWLLAAVAVLLAVGAAVWLWPDEEPIELPDFTNRPFPEAVEKLQELGLQIKPEVVRVADGKREYIVVSQDPAAGPLADRDSPVVVRYGRQAPSDVQIFLPEVLKEAAVFNPEWKESVMRVDMKHLTTVPTKP